MDLPSACKKMIDKKALGIRRKVWFDGAYIWLDKIRLSHMVEVEEFCFNTSPYSYHLTYEDAVADDWEVVLK